MKSAYSKHTYKYVPKKCSMCVRAYMWHGNLLWERGYIKKK